MSFTYRCNIFLNSINHLDFFVHLPKTQGLFRRKNISKLNDEELLAEYKKSGNSYYFGELFNRYTPLLYGVCLKYLRDPDKSQNAVMQLFEDLIPKISDYEITVFRSWIYSVVKNHCLQILRKESKEIVVDFSVDILETDNILSILAGEEADEEKIEALHHCLEKLPEQQKNCIIHFFMDEMSYADIAESTDYSLKQIKSYIQNGKRNLKICIEKNTI